MNAKLCIVAAVLALAGCHTLEPDTVRVEYDHTSHLSQHQPFTNEPTHYGINAALIVAHWGRRSGGAFLELGEGAIIDQRTTYQGEDQHGGFMGPREVFTGRIGYTFRLRDRP